MPALDIDLSLLLPTVVAQLICGKGRGKQFVSDIVSRVKRAREDEEGKSIVRSVIRENFFCDLPEKVDDSDVHASKQKHCSKVVEWRPLVMGVTHPTASGFASTVGAFVSGFLFHKVLCVVNEAAAVGPLDQ